VQVAAIILSLNTPDRYQDERVPDACLEEGLC